MKNSNTFTELSHDAVCGPLGVNAAAILRIASSYSTNNSKAELLSHDLVQFQPKIIYLKIDLSQMSVFLHYLYYRNGKTKVLCYQRYVYIRNKSTGFGFAPHAGRASTV